jgi:hypothetical protein
VDTLDKISRWASDVNAEPMIALVDKAGAGKSTIAAHMTQKWEKEGSLLTRFFFSKPSTVTGNGVATTLARDIAERYLHLIVVVEKHPNYIACSLQQQLEWLVFTPLKSLQEGTSSLVSTLARALSKYCSRVVLKMTSSLAFVSLVTSTRSTGSTFRRTPRRIHQMRMISVFISQGCSAITSLPSSTNSL